jgi:hypothetical protein
MKVSSMHRPLYSLISVFLLTVGYTPSVVPQEDGYIAMIPPFHNRLYVEGPEGSLQLARQRFVLFVYRNAVAVYASAEFLNTGKDTLTQELALPSTGHDENGSAPGGRISSGILSVQLWVEDDHVVPEVMHSGGEDWYTVTVRFTPGERRTVQSLFWAQTSLTDIDSLPGCDTVPIIEGTRGFMIDAAHASAWSGQVTSLRVTAVLRGGLSMQRDSVSAQPGSYGLADSTLTWSFRAIEPSPETNIVVFYSPSSGWGTTPNTMEKLSTFVVRRVYDQLLEYARSTEEE